jgi:hypothetical protein
MFSKSTLVLTLILAVLAAAVGTFAYSEPTSAFPVNTVEPIDTGVADQWKAGSLTVFPFFARGNADFKADLAIEGIAQGGQPGDRVSRVQIASNVLATGELHSLDHLSAASLRHNEASPKPVCGDSNGIVVFCTDICNNISGLQADIPPGMIRNPDGSCTPAPDLCSNIDGVQSAPLNPDILIEDPSQPTFCTQVIRATIYAGLHGNHALLNMANTAYMARFYVKNITITSIGGDRGRTAWPSTTPLRFKWGFCAKRGPGYASGLFTDPNDYFGSTAVGVCEKFFPDYPYRSSLPYGVWKYGSWFSSNQGHPGYLGWDGVHNAIAQWIPAEGSNVWYIGDPKGTFSGNYYDQTGSIPPALLAQSGYAGAPSYGVGVTPPPGVRPNELYDMDWIRTHLQYLLPLERLVIDDMKVPYGYKLILSNDDANSPGTLVDFHLVKNSAYVVNGGAVNVRRVNVYIPGGYGVDLDRSGVKWADNLPNGTYQVGVECSSGTGSATPSTFTLPKDGGVGLQVKCQ